MASEGEGDQRTIALPQPHLGRARRNEHRWLLRLWLVVYAFVGVQMAWVLRPFIGAPSEPAQFFRPEAWDNAYVIVARMVWQTLRR